jgi:hypothetical protein
MVLMRWREKKGKRKGVDGARGVDRMKGQEEHCFMSGGLVLGGLPGIATY